MSYQYLVRVERDEDGAVILVVIPEDEVPHRPFSERYITIRTDSELANP